MQTSSIGDPTRSGLQQGCEEIPSVWGSDKFPAIPVQSSHAPKTQPNVAASQWDAEGRYPCLGPTLRSGSGAAIYSQVLVHLQRPLLNEDHPSPCRAHEPYQRRAERNTMPSRHLSHCFPSNPLTRPATSGQPRPGTTKPICSHGLGSRPSLTQRPTTAIPAVPRTTLFSELHYPASRVNHPFINSSFFKGIIQTTHSEDILMD